MKKIDLVKQNGDVFAVDLGQSILEQVTKFLADYKKIVTLKFFNDEECVLSKDFNLEHSEQLDFLVREIIIQKHFSSVPTGTFLMNGKAPVDLFSLVRISAGSYNKYLWFGLVTDKGFVRVTHVSDYRVSYTVPNFLFATLFSVQPNSAIVNKGLHLPVNESPLCYDVFSGRASHDVILITGDDGTPIDYLVGDFDSQEASDFVGSREIVECSPVPLTPQKYKINKELDSSICNSFLAEFPSKAVMGEGVLG